ncbi:MAG: hypothetical protein IKR40_01990 [Treponema sp.]|nr:hypothetical protein [Treponema sp.]
MKTINNIESGKVVGIGKLKIFMTENFPHEIPTLSFVMAKDKEGRFVATCIQLIIEGVGETTEAAMENMRSHVMEYLQTLFSELDSEDVWNQIHELFNEPMMQELWSVYRDFQLNLAEQGISTSTKSALYDRIAELEKQIADLRALVEKNDKFEIRIVDYKEAA